MLSTSLAAGSWDATTETWTLEIVTGGEQSTITCSSVVFAVGVGSQVPLKPTYKDEVSFAYPLMFLRSKANCIRASSKVQRFTQAITRMRSHGEQSMV